MPSSTRFRPRSKRSSSSSIGHELVLAAARGALGLDERAHVGEVASLEPVARVVEHHLAPALVADPGGTRPVRHELRPDREAEDVVVDQADELHARHRVDVDGLYRGQRLLGVARPVRSGAADAQSRERPGVARGRAGGAGDRRQPLAPAPRASPAAAPPRARGTRRSSGTPDSRRRSSRRSTSSRYWVSVHCSHSWATTLMDSPGSSAVPRRELGGALLDRGPDPLPLGVVELCDRERDRPLELAGEDPELVRVFEAPAQLHLVDLDLAEPGLGKEGTMVSSSGSANTPGPSEENGCMSSSNGPFSRAWVAGPRSRSRSSWRSGRASPRPAP